MPTSSRTTASSASKHDILDKLIEQLESAKTGAGWLDADICGFLTGDTAAFAPYTRKIETAFEAIPDGWRLKTISHLPNAWLVTVELPESGDTEKAVSESLPVAICIASLRARQPRYARRAP